MRMKYLIIATVAICMILLKGIVNVYADDSIVDALQNGKVNTELKAWYQTNDKDTGDHSIFGKQNSIFDAGLGLGYTTAAFRGFSVRVNFSAVDDLNVYGNFADKSIHGVDHNKTTAWLGEAYLSYNLNSTLINIGRQNLKSPLVNSDGWAVFPNNFEAILVQNKGIRDTAMSLCYVTEERTLKSNTFEEIPEHGGIMLGVVNKSIPDTTLSGYYYHVADVTDIDALYLEAEANLGMVNVAGQYMLFNPDAVNTKKTNAFGLKVSSNVGIFNLSGAYSSVDDGTLNAARFTDSGIKTPLYTATISGDGDIAGATDTSSYKFCVGLVPVDDLKVTAGFGYYDHGSGSSARPDDESISRELSVKYTGLKNVTIFGAYINSAHNGVGAWSGADVDDDLNSIRVWAGYKF